MNVTATVDQEQRVKEQFAKETANHEMEVVRDSGLYRHLRFKQPTTIAYYFDLITWPGYLTITGDCGTFVFARTTDMFEFFERPDGGVNPGYWSEKLQAPREQAVRVYSHDAYEARVREWLSDCLEAEGMDDADWLRMEVEGQLLTERPFSADEAMRRLHDFEARGVRIYEPWEWDLCEWDHRFLWCCHAIVWGIAQYRAANREERAA